MCSFPDSVISLDTASEVSSVSLKPGEHAGFDRDEVIEFNQIILSHPEVVGALSKLGLDPNVIIQCDTWPFGADKDSPLETPRLIQAMLYTRAPNNHPDSSMYSFPISISPVFEATEKKPVRIDPLPTGGKEDGHNVFTAPAAPAAPLAHCIENEYIPTLLKTKLRDDVKPLIVQQPEGHESSSVGLN